MDEQILLPDEEIQRLASEEKAKAERKAELERARLEWFRNLTEVKP